MIYLYSVLFGLAFGSFANVCIYRLPLDKSILRPRSFCPNCGKTVRAIDNIPVLSFLCLKGRCSGCRQPISWQYPLVELSMCLLFTFHAWFFQGATQHLIVADVLAFHLLCISVIDFHHLIIPDELSFSLIVFGLALSPWNPLLKGIAGYRILESLVAGICSGGLLLLLAWGGEKMFKKEALGGGDVKLIAGMAAMMGWLGLIGPLFLGSLAGGAAAIGLILAGKKRLGETLPFGPFLSFGAYMACLFPSILIRLFTKI